MLNDAQKQKLLKIARQAIQAYLKEGKPLQVDEKDPVLAQNMGAFVSLHKQGNLRGCIGYVEPIKPLIEAVRDVAIEAAFNDPRFQPLEENELDKIDIEISAMSPLQKITDINKIQVGVHGILIRKGFYSGLLLPQVATEYKWNKEEFLENTCHKAGLPGDAWKKGAEIYIFSAEVFGEK